MVRINYYRTAKDKYCLSNPFSPDLFCHWPPCPMRPVQGSEGWCGTGTLGGHPPVRSVWTGCSLGGQTRWRPTYSLHSVQDTGIWDGKNVCNLKSLIHTYILLFISMFIQLGKTCISFLVYNFKLCDFFQIFKTTKTLQNNKIHAWREWQYMYRSIDKKFV